MKEVLELNKRILAEAKDAVPEEWGFILVCRDDNDPSELAKLPSTIQAELIELKHRLNQIVPDDFGYYITLGCEDPGFVLTYSDGPQTVGNISIKWNVKHSLIPQLEKVDWEKQRGRVIGRGHTFDEMREVAKHIEPKIEPTSEVQKRFCREVRAFEENKRKDRSKIYMLLWREDKGASTERLKSMKALEGMLCDTMATGYLTLAVMVKGRLLAAQKIDEVKDRVLKEMRTHMPISWAITVGLI